MHPVLGLVGDDGLGSVDDLVDYLIASMSWQAMHEDRSGGCRRH
jgi:hypothetical protein